MYGNELMIESLKMSVVTRPDGSTVAMTIENSTLKFIPVDFSS